MSFQRTSGAALTERHLEIIGSGAVLAGSVDREGRPDLARVFGVAVHDDRRTLRVLVAAPWARKIVANLDDGGWIALTFTDPATYQSFQAKGHVQRIDEPTDEDRALALRHRDEFARVALSVGVHMSTRDYAHAPVAAVTFQIEQLYCQTPGPGAGEPVGGAS